ncbi:MAG: hypothetical protein M3Y44_15485 [Actinomycetota bacterium]|nr:hypothetical protein [Actinomycetota bacterium]
MWHVRRLLGPVIAALLAVPLLNGCGGVVDGNGSPSAQSTSGTATGAPSSASSATTQAPTTSASTATGSPTSPEPNLSSLLAPAPPGSKPWNTAWSKTATPTLAEFVAHVYPATSVAVATSQLKAQGLTEIAHATWIATDANQADVILLRFATTAGAVSRFRSATAAQADNKGQLHFDVPGFADAIGYYQTALDPLGDIRTIVYGQVGDIVVEVFFYSPAKLDQAAAVAAITAQLRLLPA